jgi:hypothetical protein
MATVTWAPAPHWQTQPSTPPGSTLNSGGSPLPTTTPWDWGTGNQPPGDRIFDGFSSQLNGAWLNVDEQTVLGTIDTYGAAGQGPGTLASLAILGSLPKFELEAAQKADEHLFDNGKSFGVDKKQSDAEAMLPNTSYYQTVVMPFFKNLPKV